MGKKKSAPAPAGVEDLVLRALRLAANSAGTAKWLGKSNKALFNQNEENHQAAIEECTRPGEVLLEKVGEFGRLTPAGFARSLSGVPPAEVGDQVLKYAAGLGEGDRAALKPALDGRTSGPGGELIAAAVTALDAEEERRAAERAESAARAQLSRYRQVHGIKEKAVARLERELALARKEAAAFGKLVADLEAAPPEPDPPPTGTTAQPPRPPEPVTPEERSFHRNVSRRLVSAWLEAIRMGKAEARQFLEVVIGNVAGLEQIGEDGERVRFDGTYHRATTGVAPGAPVAVVHPGWKLLEEKGEYVVEPALVAP
ncbi:MAG: hypothetical protein C0501_26120 [Isosphaera sp.]|nr:hypothetical protein [Isosphaera sp.]